MLKSYTKEGNKYGVLELVLEGPSEGNPFVEQWVKGSFSCDAERRMRKVFMMATESIDSVSCPPLRWNIGALSARAGARRRR